MSALSRRAGLKLQARAGLFAVFLAVFLLLQYLGPSVQSQGLTVKGGESRRRKEEDLEQEVIQWPGAARHLLDVVHVGRDLLQDDNVEGSGLGGPEDKEECSPPPPVISCEPSDEDLGKEDGRAGKKPCKTGLRISTSLTLSIHRPLVQV
jgi:hypothetical protein